MIRVLIADDENLIRAGIRLVLTHDADIEVVAEASNGKDALVHIHRGNIDVALIDLRMPGMDGLATLEAIAQHAYDTKAVVLTTFAQEEHLVRALQAGAAGFLLKNLPPHELIHAVKAVHEGHRMLSPRITLRLIDHYLQGDVSRRPAARARVSELTAREIEVLALLGLGESNAVIAGKLFISEDTVKVHVRRILAKLNCANRVQAALIAHDAGLPSGNAWPGGVPANG